MNKEVMSTYFEVSILSFYSNFVSIYDKNTAGAAMFAFHMTTIKSIKEEYMDIYIKTIIELISNQKNSCFNLIQRWLEENGYVEDNINMTDIYNEIGWNN